MRNTPVEGAVSGVCPFLPDGLLICPLQNSLQGLEIAELRTRIDDLEN